MTWGFQAPHPSFQISAPKQYTMASPPSKMSRIWFSREKGDTGLSTALGRTSIKVGTCCLQGTELPGGEGGYKELLLLWELHAWKPSCDIGPVFPRTALVVT